MDDAPNTPSMLVVHPVAHLAPEVHRAGFELNSPYLERCWAPVLGPTSVLLLRRLSSLWHEQAPAEIPTGDLGLLLGVGPSTGRRGTMSRTLDRLVRFRFATWGVETGHLGVYTEVRPVPERHLKRLPARVQQDHETLLGEHLDRIARHASAATPAERVSQHLERFQQRTATRRNLHR